MGLCWELKVGSLRVDAEVIRDYDEDEAGVEWMAPLYPSDILDDDDDVRCCWRWKRSSCARSS